MRKGFSLLAALVVSATVALVVSGVAYLNVGRSKVFINTSWTEKALNSAKSGVTFALTKIENGEVVSGTATYIKSLSDGSEFEVRVTKVDDKTYHVESTGKYKDAFKRVVVDVKKSGGDYYPFMIREKLMLKSWDTPFGAKPVWDREETKIAVGNISDGDKEILENDGFDFVDDKVSPPTTDVVSKEDPIVPNIDVPDRSECDLVVNSGKLDLTSVINSCTSSDSCGTNDDPYVICGPKNNSLKVENSNLSLSMASNKDINIVILSDKDLIFDDEFKISSGGNPNSLAFKFIAKSGSLKVTNGINLASFNVKEGVSINFWAHKLVDLGDFKLNKFNSDGDIDVNLYSEEKIKLKNIDFSSFSANGHINFQSYSGKVTEVVGDMTYKSFSNASNINLYVSSGEDMIVHGKVTYKSLHSLGDLFLKFISNKNIKFVDSGGIDVKSLSWSGRSSLDIEAEEDLILKEGIKFYSLSSNGDFSLVLLSSNKSIKNTGTGYLVDLSSGSFISRVNMFLVAGKSINPSSSSKGVLNVRSLHLGNGINTILWAKESVNARTDFDSFSLSSDINFAVLAKDLTWWFSSLSFSFSFLWGKRPYSGLTFEELQSLCSSSNIPGEVKKIPCAIVSAIGGNGTGSYELTGWQIY